MKSKDTAKERLIKAQQTLDLADVCEKKWAARDDNKDIDFPEEQENRVEMDSPAECYDPERTIADLEDDVEKLKHVLAAKEAAIKELVAENVTLGQINAVFQETNKLLETTITEQKRLVEYREHQLAKAGVFLDEDDE